MPGVCLPTPSLVSYGLLTGYGAALPAVELGWLLLSGVRGGREGRRGARESRRGQRRVKELEGEGQGRENGTREAKGAAAMVTKYS